MIFEIIRCTLIIVFCFFKYIHIFFSLQCQNFSHVGSNHLLELCRRLGPLVDKEVPTNVRGVHSLLGAGRQSILRRKEGIIYTLLNSINCKP